MNVSRWCIVMMCVMDCVVMENVGGKYDRMCKLSHLTAQANNSKILSAHSPPTVRGTFLVGTDERRIDVGGQKDW